MTASWDGWPFRGTVVLSSVYFQVLQFDDVCVVVGPSQIQHGQESVADRQAIRQSGPAPPA